ncbi:hypothetical protein [Streptomyces sp. NPDC020983]|uniref:hypothetical protein n=1 Tax=Streptomyces sp. NPDC020983 TaxID=3365106 RepID=UPI00379BB1AA
MENDSRPTAGVITDAQLDDLYADRDRAHAALRRIADLRREERPLDILGVRRYSEPGQTTPIAIDGRDSCGTFSDHVRAECIGLSYTDRRGGYGLIHLTAQDALRLADLLRAMASPESDLATTGHSACYGCETCGFHWHGRTPSEVVPMHDGQPVCPRCELDRIEREAS